MTKSDELEKVTKAIRMGVRGDVRISLDWLHAQTGFNTNRLAHLVAWGERHKTYAIERLTARLGVVEWRFAMASNPAQWSRWSYRHEAEGKSRERIVEMIREACQRHMPMRAGQIKHELGIPPTAATQILKKMADLGCIDMERFSRPNGTASYRFRVDDLEWTPWNNGEPNGTGDTFGGFESRLLAPETTDTRQLFEDDPRAISSREPIYVKHKIMDRSGIGCGTALCSEA